MGLLMDDINIDTTSSTITLKDLLYMYLREVESAHNKIQNLENRVNRDIDQITIDYRQYKVTTDENIKDLSNEIKDLKVIINDVSTGMTKLIASIEKEGINKDHQHDLDIAELKRNSIISGGTSGVVATTLLEFITEYIKLIIH